MRIFSYNFILILFKIRDQPTVLTIVLTAFSNSLIIHE